MWGRIKPGFRLISTVNIFFLCISAKICSDTGIYPAEQLIVISKPITVSIRGVRLASFQLIFGFDFGKRNELPVTFLHGAGTHNLLYHFITYLSTDGTSQNGGEFIYEWIENGGLLQFRYYNDWYGWEFTDGFRTAASELSYSRIVGKDIIGGGFGFSLWTASIKEVGWLQRGQVYDLSAVSTVRGIRMVLSI